MTRARGAVGAACSCFFVACGGLGGFFAVGVTRCLGLPLPSTEPWLPPFPSPRTCRLPSGRLGPRVGVDVTVLGQVEREGHLFALALPVRLPPARCLLLARFGLGCCLRCESEHRPCGVPGSGGPWGLWVPTPVVLGDIHGVLFGAGGGAGGAGPFLRERPSLLTRRSRGVCFLASSAGLLACELTRQPYRGLAVRQSPALPPSGALLLGEPGRLEFLCAPEKFEELRLPFRLARGAGWVSRPRFRLAFLALPLLGGAQSRASLLVGVDPEAVGWGCGAAGFGLRIGWWDWWGARAGSGERSTVSGAGPARALRRSDPVGVSSGSSLTLAGRWGPPGVVTPWHRTRGRAGRRPLLLIGPTRTPRKSDPLGRGYPAGVPSGSLFTLPGRLGPSGVVTPRSGWEGARWLWGQLTCGLAAPVHLHWFRRVPGWV